MAGPGTKLDISDLRALVVDDDPVVRDLIGDILRSVGIARVHTAENGGRAWRMIARTELDYHLIISDWHMPGMDGLELLRRIRACGSEVAFMMVTENVTREAVATAARYGVSAYLGKPFTTAQMQRKIQALADSITGGTEG